MGRTTNEILTDIKADVKKNSTFANITENKSSAFYYLCWIFAKAIHVYEQILDAHREYVTKIVQEQKVGTSKWYVEEVKKFQKDTNLNELGEYDNIDTTKQIIKHCAIAEDRNDGKLLIKIKGETKEITDAPTLTQINEYINKVKFAGTEITIQSKPSNKMKINGLQVKFEPLVYSDESILLDLIKKKIKEYFNNLPFNSLFLLQEMLNHIEKIEGVKNVYISIDNVLIDNVVMQSPTQVIDSGWLELDNTSYYDIEAI